MPVRASLWALLVALAFVEAYPAGGAHVGPWHTADFVSEPETGPVQGSFGLLGGGGASVSGDGRLVAVVRAAPPNYPDCNSTVCFTYYVTDMETDESRALGIAWDGDALSVILPRPDISADGAFAAGASHAPSNAATGVYVFGLASPSSERADVSSGGAAGNGSAGNASLSGDGRFVAFESTAGNLVPGDTNQCQSATPTCNDVFVRDRLLGTTERVSVTSSGEQADGASSSASISTDGRYVVFTSDAPDLMGPAAQGQSPPPAQVFRHDRETGETLLVSESKDGGPSNGQASSPAVSAGGRYVAFSSLASDLVGDDTNGDRDVFVRDMASGTTERINLRAGGHQTLDGFGAGSPTISDDGGRVAFTSDSADLDPDAPDTCGSVKCNDVFVWERASGEVYKVNVSVAGDHANGRSSQSAISAQGRHVVFSSGADNLVEGQDGGFFMAVRSGLVWGDVGCDGAADPGDALALLLQSAGVESPDPECAFGQVLTAGGQQLWRDWDCDGVLAALDAVPLLRHFAALPTGDGNCAPVGSDVELPG